MTENLLQPYTAPEITVLSGIVQQPLCVSGGTQEYENDPNPFAW